MNKAVGLRLRAYGAIQRGTSLVEVLVSLVLVAVAMLGLLGLQLRSHAQQKDSFDRRTAAGIVAEFADRISGNYTGFEDGNYSGLAFRRGRPRRAWQRPAARVVCRQPLRPEIGLGCKSKCETGFLAGLLLSIRF